MNKKIKDSEEKQGKTEKKRKEREEIGESKGEERTGRRTEGNTRKQELFQESSET